MAAARAASHGCRSASDNGIPELILSESVNTLKCHGINRVPYEMRIEPRLSLVQTTRGPDMQTVVSADLPLFSMV